MAHSSDIEIARRAEMQPIDRIAETVGLDPGRIEHYGRHKARIGFDQIDALAGAPAGKLVLVSAITPTPAGEGSWSQTGSRRLIPSRT